MSQSNLQDPSVVSTNSMTEYEPLKIVETDAMQFYSRGNPPFHYPLRQYLRSDVVGKLVVARGRPLSLDEVKFLVRPETEDNSVDGKLVQEKCIVTSEMFTPVRWLDIGNPKFLELVSKMSLREAAEEARVFIFGAYYINPENECNYGAFSGAPWFFDKKTNTYYGNKNSPLHKAFLQADFKRGICKVDLDYHLQVITQEYEEEAKEREQALKRRAEQEGVIKDFFARGNQPGRGCGSKK